jgi:hypothetical protein
LAAKIKVKIMVKIKVKVKVKATAVQSARHCTALHGMAQTGEEREPGERPRF